MFLDLFERHYVNGKEKKVLSEQKRQIRAENIFQVCYDDYCERRMALSKKLLVS